MFIFGILFVIMLLALPVVLIAPFIIKGKKKKKGNKDKR